MILLVVEEGLTAFKLLAFLVVLPLSAWKLVDPAPYLVIVPGS